MSTGLISDLLNIQPQTSTPEMHIPIFGPSRKQ